MSIHWENLAWSVFSQVWQVAVVALLVAITVRLSCRHRPHLAYLLWMLVLLKSLTPPIWSSPVGLFSWTQMELELSDRQPSQLGPIVTDTIVLADTTPLLEEDPSGDRIAPRRRKPAGELSTAVEPPAYRDSHRSTLSWPAIAAMVWISGSVMVLAIVIVRLLGCLLIARRSAEITEGEIAESLQRLASRLGVHRRARLLVTKRQVGPVVFGFLRPTILLPESLMQHKSASELEPILAHELIHFRRGDTRCGWLQVAAQILWWFHPMVWWASRQATSERERCCDEEVIMGLACNPGDYAQLLIDVLKERQLKPLYALPGMRVVEITTRRLEHIMHRSDQFCRRTPRWQWMAFLVTAAILLPGSGLLITRGQATAGDAADRFPVPNKSKRGEWNQFGGSSHRNNTPDGDNAPTQWDYKSGKNIRWSAKLGSSTYTSPVVADGKVFIGTNNDGGRIEEFPAEVDLSCLLCFDEESGDFLWQYSIEKLKEGRIFDWPTLGLCSVAMVEGKRLWVVTTRCEVVCLDTDGFRDKENDGPFRNERLTSKNDADIIWKYNMREELEIYPHNLSNCSVTCAGDVLLVGTSNGVDESHVRIPNPDAPCFIALERTSGKLLWKSNLPGKNILHGQWSSPSYGVFEGVPQAIFAGGDGWLYGFDLRDMRRGETALLWKFDCNPKTSVWALGGLGTRNNLLATPVIYDGLVYIAVGQDIEHGEGDGCLWCIDPTKRGDISSELVYNQSDPETPIPHKRIQACEKDKGDFVRPNPNSGVVWKYDRFDRNGDGKIEADEIMHRTVSSPSIKNDLLVLPDTTGFAHCVNAKTGLVHWVYDLFAASYGSPLIIDGKVYLGDEDGDVTIFKLSNQLTVIEESTVGDSIASSLVFAGDSLYIPTRKRLFSIRAPQQDEKKEVDAPKHGSSLITPPLWRFAKEGAVFEASPLIWKESVFAADLGGKLYSIDRATGAVNWRFSTESSFNAGPWLSNGSIYIGDTNGSFYCIDALTGEEVWRHRTQGEINGGAAFYKDRVIFASQDAHLYCVDNKTGGLLWRFQSDDQIRSTPAVVEEFVVVSGCGSELMIVDVMTGRQINTFDLESPTMSSPVERDGRIYVGTEDGHMFCIELTTMNLIWRYKPIARGRGIRSAPTVHDDLVLFGCRDKHFYALDRKTGKQIWKFKTKGSVTASPIVLGARVYGGSADGRLYGVEIATGRKTLEYETGGDILHTASFDDEGMAVAADKQVIYLRRGSD